MMHSIKLNMHWYVCIWFSVFLTMMYANFGLQIPSIHILQYTTQVLGVILALLDDLDESVQLTAVSCLLTVSSVVWACLCSSSRVLWNNLCDPLFYCPLQSWFIYVIRYFIVHLFWLFSDTWVIPKWSSGGTNFA